MSEQIDIDALEALARSATPGPWAPYETVQADNVVTAGGGLLTGAIVCGPTYERTNTHFIAAVNPDVVLALIAELRAARDGVVAEEPEWAAEYASGPSPQALVRTSRRGDRYAHETAYERKVTPWVPVKQEGAGT